MIAAGVLVLQAGRAGYDPPGPIGEGMERSRIRLRINNSCLRCGFCVQMCPVQAITVKAGIFVIGPACIACDACLEICPAGAVVDEKPGEG